MSDMENLFGLSSVAPATPKKGKARPTWVAPVVVLSVALIGLAVGAFVAGQPHQQQRSGVAVPQPLSLELPQAPPQPVARYVPPAPFAVPVLPYVPPLPPALPVQDAVKAALTQAGVEDEPAAQAARDIDRAIRGEIASATSPDALLEQMWVRAFLASLAALWLIALVALFKRRVALDPKRRLTRLEREYAVYRAEQLIGRRLGNDAKPSDAVRVLLELGWTPPR
jgi:hypothetical protein